MNIVEVATQMRPLVRNATIIVVGGEATDTTHLLDMITAIEEGKVTGEKAHRWLGWIQGVVCCRGGATLEEMKEINNGDERILR
jgi:hypothetical protein